MELIIIPNQCTIGPVSVEIANLRQGDEFDPEKFDIICSHTQALQIRGMASTVAVDKYSNTTLVSNDCKWGPVWIDGSINRTDNDSMIHRGWYLIDKVTSNVTDYGIYAVLTLEVTKIASDINEILTMQYTPGVNDNTNLDSSYDDTVQVHSLQETFTSFDDEGVWDPILSSGINSPAITGDGKLNMSGYSTTSGTYGYVWTKGQEHLETPPYTLEVNMEWVTQPVGYPHRLMFVISPNDGIDVTESITLVLLVSNSSVKYYAYKVTDTDVIHTLLSSTTISTSIKNLTWAITCSKDGHITLYLDTGSGYVKKYYGPTTFKSWSDLYYKFIFGNQSNQNATVKSAYINIYDYPNTVPRNVIALPVTSNLGKAASFTRASADGSIPCYTNPTDPLTFQISAVDIYKGSVTAYSTNVTGGASTLITSPEHVISPTKFTVDNKLVKLETTANSVKFYSGNGSWALLNEFIFPSNIKLIKALYVSPERFVFQIDRTIWTLERGKQFVRVQHPTTELSYTRRTCYYHDGISSTPAPETDITMLESSFCNIWSKGTGTCAAPDPADNTRLQIIKVHPTVILSDSLPEDTITGIGWYNATLNDDNSSSFVNIPKEFMLQPRQNIAIKGI